MRTEVSRPFGLAVSDLVQTERLRIVLTAVLLMATALLFGPAAGMLVVGGQAFAAAFFAVVLLPLIFWRVPGSPVILLVLAATNIERLGDDHLDAITANIPLFRSLRDSYGIPGAIVAPIECFIILALLIWIAKAISDRRLTFKPSPLGIGVVFLLTMALFGEFYGLARGAIFNISLWELRPFLYLAAAYLLASQLISTSAMLDAILWGIVIGTGLKGIVGTERVITLANVVPHPDAILEHDESFFFSIFILLTVAMWVLRKRGKLRMVATLLLPFVLTADLGNHRRAAWVILPAVAIAFWAVMYQRTPQRRRTLGIVGGAVLVLGSAYVAAFNNSDSLVGEPASAIWSQFSPNTRDYNSNQYRILENQNLALDIRESFLTGTGFGVPINHPVPIFDASSLDPLINFIPHNTILYVWLRLGTLGAIAFWFVVGAAMVSACRLARHPDRDLCLFGTVTLVSTIAWVLQGRLDKGIPSFRIVIMVGCLLGALEAARRLGQIRLVERLAGVGAERGAVPTEARQGDQAGAPQRPALLLPPAIRKRAAVYGRGPNGRTNAAVRRVRDPGGGPPPALRVPRTR